MPNSDDDRMKTVRAWVWSGFYGPEEVDGLIDQMVEDDAGQADAGQVGADRGTLCAAAGREFAAKAAAERRWPAVTDCDRLDQAFDALEAAGVVTLQNAGYTMSDGLSDVSAEYLDRGRPAGVRGWCFYHGQDLERAVLGGGLLLAFGTFADEAPEHRAAVGQLVKDTLERHGLSVAWSGDPGDRLKVGTDWKRRGAGPD